MVEARRGRSHCLVDWLQQMGCRNKQVRREQAKSQAHQAQGGHWAKHSSQYAGQARRTDTHRKIDTLPRERSGLLPRGEANKHWARSRATQC